MSQTIENEIKRLEMVIRDEKKKLDSLRGSRDQQVSFLLNEWRRLGHDQIKAEIMKLMDH